MVADLRFTFHYSLVTNLDFFLVNGNYAVGAHHCAAGAANATVVHGLGVVVTFTVYIFRQRDALHRADGYADSAAFTALGIDYDLSFKCHRFEFYVINNKKRLVKTHPKQ